MHSRSIRKNEFQETFVNLIKGYSINIVKRRCNLLRRSWHWKDIMFFSVGIIIWT